MKIKGVYKDKSRYGEPVELSAEEKVGTALQEAVANDKGFVEKYLTYTRDLKIAELHYVPKGELLKKKWQNNIYTAHGTVTLHQRNIHTNAMTPPKATSFRIKFEDGLDANGLPDLQILEFSVS